MNELGRTRSLKSRSGAEEEVLGLRFRITWPYWAAPYPDQITALKIYNENQLGLQKAIGDWVSENIGVNIQAGEFYASEFPPCGIELSFRLMSSSMTQIEASSAREIVRALGPVVRSFFETHMPRGRSGANLYEVESEFWSPRQWLQKVEIPNLSTQVIQNDTNFSTNTLATESLHIPRLSDKEFQELLTALAHKHLRHEFLRAESAGLQKNTDELLSTRRFLQALLDRPERAALFSDALSQELRETSVKSIVTALHDSGILDALDELPQLVFANLRRSVVPEEDIGIFRRAGIDDPEAEMILLIHHAQLFASSHRTSSSVFREADGLLTRSGADLKRQDTPRRKRKVCDGIGNLLLGVATAGGNALLGAGTIVAPNPATGYAVISSTAVAVGAIFKGLGDLRGE